MSKINSGSVTATLPQSMDLEREGILYVRIKMRDTTDESEVSEARDQLSGELAQELDECLDADQSVGMMSVDFHIDIEGLSQEELDDNTPDNYLRNGLVAGILKELVSGLVDSNSINLERAIKRAVSKGQSANNILCAEEASGKLSELLLAISDTGGEA